MPRKVRLLVAGEQALVVDGLAALCASDMDVLGRCRLDPDLDAALRRHRPDVLIVEGGDDHQRAFDVVRRLRGAGDRTPVVLVTGQPGEHEAAEALRLGVAGLVLRTMPTELLLRCVGKVAAGERWFEREGLGRLARRFLRLDVGRSPLTDRQTEVVRLVVQGLRNRAIADRLRIGEGTVKNHLHSIYRRLDVSSRTELVRQVHQRRLV